MHALPHTGFLRIRDIIGDKKAGIPAIIPVSRSTFLLGVQRKKYPQPTRNLAGARITVWRAEEIIAFVESNTAKVAA